MNWHILLKKIAVFAPKHMFYFAVETKNFPRRAQDMLCFIGVILSILYLSARVFSLSSIWKYLKKLKKIFYRREL